MGRRLRRLQLLNPEHDRFAVDAVELLDLGEGLLEEAEGAGVKKEDHVDEIGVGGFWIHGGVGAGNADAGFCESLRDFSDDAGAIGDIEADVVGGFGFFDGHQAALFGVRKEAAVAGGLTKGTSGFDEVADNRRGGGILSGTASVEEGFAGGIAMDGDGIEDAVDAGEDVAFGDEGGLEAEFDAVLMLADDGEKFDDVAEARGELDVDRTDLLDAGDVDFFRVDRETVGEGREQDGLVGGVPAVDVERGIGFGVAELLGLGEGGFKVESASGHALEDVVRGAVDDADHRVDAVADEGLLDGLDDRDASGDGGFKVDRGVEFFREREEFGAAFGEQCFVAGDDGFFRAERCGDDVEGVAGATDELDDDVDSWVFNDLLPLGGELVGRDVDGALFIEVADEDLGDVEIDEAAGAVGDEGGVALKSEDHAGADGAEASEADAES